ncbi:MAG TPA: IclR family transcriptional regulator [Microbacterium sp.]|nr:IclR family transcriptional regulator [Microbacterium sp.]
MSPSAVASKRIAEPPTGSFDRVTHVLLALAHMDAPRIAEIGAFTGLPVSAVYRCIASLVEAGLVEEGPTHGRYHAGAVTISLAERYRRSSLSAGHTARSLAELAAHTQEFAALLIRSGDEIVCVDAADGSRVLRCSFTIGEVVPMIAGASAKAVLAHLPDEEVREVLDRNGVTEADAERVRASLPGIRERGFAVSSDEVDEGVWGVSAPVFSHGSVVGSVSTMAPVFRANQLTVRAVRATVMAAQALTRLDLSL